MFYIEDRHTCTSRSIINPPHACIYGLIFSLYDLGILARYKFAPVAIRKATVVIYNNSLKYM